MSPGGDRRAVALLERLELELGGCVGVGDLDGRCAVIGERHLGKTVDGLLRLAPCRVRHGLDEVEDVDLTGVRVGRRVGHDDARAGGGAAQDLTDRVVGRDLHGQDGVLVVADRSDLLTGLGVERRQRIRHELSGLDGVAGALFDHRRLQGRDLQRRRERRGGLLADRSLDRDRIGGVARRRRGGAEVDDRRRRTGSLRFPARLAEQPARTAAERATAERATSGRMRTVNLKTEGRGSLHLPPCFLCPRWEGVMPGRGMDSGVPSTGDFRGPSRTPRSRLPQRRRRPADGCDVRPRSLRRRPAGSAHLPASRRGQGERAEVRTGHLREQSPLVHRLRSPSPWRRRDRSISSPSRATSKAPGCRAGSRASSSPRSAPCRCSAARAKPRWMRSTSSVSCWSGATRSRCTRRARARSTGGSTRAAPAWRSSRSRAVRRSCRSA